MKGDGAQTAAGGRGDLTSSKGTLLCPSLVGDTPFSLGVTQWAGWFLSGGGYRDQLGLSQGSCPGIMAQMLQGWELHPNLCWEPWIVREESEMQSTGLSTGKPFLRLLCGENRGGRLWAPPVPSCPALAWPPVTFRACQLPPAPGSSCRSSCCDLVLGGVSVLGPGCT